MDLLTNTRLFDRLISGIFRFGSIANSVMAVFPLKIKVERLSEGFVHCVSKTDPVLSSDETPIGPATLPVFLTFTVKVFKGSTNLAFLIL